MNIAIVDDKIQDCVMLGSLIQQYSEENAVLMTISNYGSGEEFLVNAHLSEIDVVFLDIYMDGLNGMEVANYMRQKGETVPIVFFTNSQAHAVQSYEVRAFDYLVKPITIKKIARTLELLQQVQEKSSNYIIVKEGREFKRIMIDDIDYVDYYNHYIQIHMEDRVIRSYQKFADFEKKVAKYANFLTCHRCIMVHMDHVEKLEKGCFVMKNGEIVPINRKYLKEIKARYFNYVFGEMESDLGG